jgi:predicted alpha/beta hydrolase family esterase
MRWISIPGYGSSGPEHWQTRWEAAHPSVVRIRPASWEEPRLDDWMRAIGETSPGADSVLIAHSMGCLAAVEWLGRTHQRVAGAFLVAPPDPASPAYPPQAAEFAEIARRPLEIPALVVASEDDPHCTHARAERFARTWNAGFASVGHRGHINSASGLGDWPEGRALLDGLIASIP